MKRTRKAKATQARKLRNSAKGKVPKSALGELGKALNAAPGAAVPWRNWRWSQGFTCYPGAFLDTTCRATTAERSPGNTEMNESHRPDPPRSTV